MSEKKKKKKRNAYIPTPRVIKNKIKYMLIVK
jgi:hypothetical protein